MTLTIENYVMQEINKAWYYFNLEAMLNEF